jgi:hypothetical protein
VSGGIVATYASTIPNVTPPPPQNEPLEAHTTTWTCNGNSLSLTVAVSGSPIPEVTTLSRG